MLNRTLVVFLSLLAASINGFARDITTLKNETYHEISVISVGGDGLKIMHRDGIVVLPISELPADLRREFYPESPVPTQSATTAVLPTEITTIEGNVYYNVTLLGVEKSGLRISHRYGIGFLDFLSLSTALRQAFGYSATAYAEGTAERALKARQAVEQRAAAEVEAKDAQQRSLAADVVKNTSILDRDYSATGYVTRGYNSNRYERSGYTGGSVYVHGYRRKDGTYVRPHTRSR